MPPIETNGWERWRGESSAKLESIDTRLEVIFEKLDELADWKVSVESRLARLSLVFGFIGGTIAVIGELLIRAFKP